MKVPFLHKYKPFKISDFYLNPSLFALLDTILKGNNIAIMFEGSSGCGKTSLINTIINTYHHGCESGDDILYINSLHEQGINFYRNDVKLFFQTNSSVPGKKKLIVLDDLDIVNEQCQQILKNYIVKYGDNVNIVASCMSGSVHNVIDTIQSLLTIIHLPHITDIQIKFVMHTIIKGENIKVSPDAEELIIQISNNCIKTMINHMEKLCLMNYDVINLPVVSEVCISMHPKLFEDYIGVLNKGDLSGGICLAYEMVNMGFSVIDILGGFFKFIKNSDNSILSETKKYEIITVISKFIESFYNIHENDIEMALLTNNVYKIINKNIEV